MVGTLVVGALLVIAALLESGALRLPHAALLLAPITLTIGVRLLWSRSEGARHFRTSAAIAIALFIALAALSGLHEGPSPTSGGSARYWIAFRTIALLPGWAVISMLALSNAPVASGADPRIQQTPWLAPLVVAAGACLLAIGRGVVDGAAVFNIDEVLYVWQGQAFSEGALGRPLDPAIEPFFRIKQTFFREGQLFTQYPPGWPALLALGKLLGIERWIGLVLATTALACTYAVGRQVRDAWTGAVATALLGTTGLFLTFGATMLSHGASMCVVVMAAYLLLRGEDEGARGRIGGWILAGVLLGVAVAIRPLTGGLVGLSLTLWIFSRNCLTRRARTTFVVSVATGGVPVIALVLLYNAATTGDALTFGYTAANGPLHSLGFGMRGYREFDALGHPISDAALFTPVVALGQFASGSWNAAARLVGAALVVPALVLAATHGTRFRWRSIGAFALLPAVHALYWFAAPRFFLELYPFAAVGIAWALREARSTLPHARVVGLMLAANLMTWGMATVWDRREEYRTMRAPIVAADSLQRAVGPVILLVRVDTEVARHAFHQLYFHNTRAFPGDIVVARDLGERNATLLRCLPSHRAIRVEVADSLGRLRFVPLEPPVAPGALAGEPRCFAAPS